MRKYIYLFIFFLLYQTSSFSKISDVNKFDQKNLSNYFSAVLSINNNDAKNSLKFLENSKILNNKHEEHFKNYIKSLVANEKVDLAIKKIKYSQNNYSFLEREVILLVDNLINKIGFRKVTAMGSIGCKIASIIRGESDIYISLSLPGKSSPKDWDFAAPEAILRAAGGSITNLENEELTYNSLNFEQGGIIVATNCKHAHKSTCLKIKEIIKKYDLYPCRD